MAKILVSEVEGRTAADVMHPTLTTVPASAPVEELRAYFASSSSHRLATLTDGDRYAGSVYVDELPEDAEGVAGDHVGAHPTTTPDASAADARDLALGTPSRRVPVVDADGRLVGVVAIDKYLEGFCGTE